RSRIQNRLVDLCPCGHGRAAAVSCFVPSRPSGPPAPRVGLQPAETATGRSGTGCRSHRPVAEKGLAADQKKACRRGATIAFIDETGFRLQPVNRRTWAPCGETPVQRAWDRYDRLSVIGAITISP